MRQWLVRLTVLLFAASGVVNAAGLVEGQDYTVISPAQLTSNPNKIVVTEFFSYQCPHCWEFYPVLSSWVAKQASDVAFERVPVSFGRSNWAAIAQGFYALQAMGVVDRLDGAIFNAIHVQGIKLSDEASIADWVGKQGVNPQDFSAAYESFGVKSKMTRGEQMITTYHVDSVPTVVIDGKYIPLGKTHDDQLAIAGQLIAMIRANKGHK